MKINLNLDIEDWTQLKYCMLDEVNSKSKRLWLNVVIWATTGGIFIVVLNKFSYFHWPTGSLVVILFIFFIFEAYYSSKKFIKFFNPSLDGIFCGDHIYEFDKDGVTDSGLGYKRRYSWNVVKRLDRKNGLIMIFVDNFSILAFPEKKLTDPDGLYDLLVELNDQ